MVLGRLEQPRHYKKLLYLHYKHNEPTKEGPISFVLFESPLTSASTVSKGHPSLVSLYRTNISIGLQLMDWQHWTNDSPTAIGLTEIFRQKMGYFYNFCVFFTNCSLFWRVFFLQISARTHDLLASILFLASLLLSTSLLMLLLLLASLLLLTSLLLWVSLLLLKSVIFLLYLLLSTR